ncbi:MAG: PaaI family thioesterase [Candidatus Liptonbacteria bacterium]|nr:PaaI family thioesterase [Candidatus Liptonbacteria bacterium]
MNTKAADQGTERIEFLKRQFSEDHFTTFLGMRLEKLESGYAEVSMAVRTGMTTREGVVNGGITATLANTASVYAGMTVEVQDRDLLIHISMDFIKSVREWPLLVARATVIKETAKQAFVSVEVVNADDGDEIVAFGTMTYHKPPARK